MRKWMNVRCRCLAITLLAALSPCSVSNAQEARKLERYLIFHSSMDDVTDVNLFGANEGGWIYTAESTDRKEVLVQNRCGDRVHIVKGEGRLGDCLRFSEKLDKVLFYMANASLEKPRTNWSGSVAFWLKPDIDKLGPEDGIPLMLFNGDWNHGGFYLRFPCMAKTSFEFAAVSISETVEAPNSDIDAIPATQHAAIIVEEAPFASDKWTHVLFTFEGVNPDVSGLSAARLYLNGKPCGEVKRPLGCSWMAPGAWPEEENGALFLGIDFIGDLDDLRMYNKSLTDDEVRVLYNSARK